MAYKKAKSLKFPGLPDTYTIPQVADGVSGNAAVLDGNGNVGDSGIPTAKIAQTDGSYAQMNVGTADNLVDKSGAGAQQEIVFRPTAGTRSIERASAEIKSIYGKTLVWNQLVDSDTTVVAIDTGHTYVAAIDGTDSLIISGTTISVTGGTDNVFDLTRMFGAGNEPSTVEEFRALFPISYYSYDPGSLLNFKGTGIKTVGFNQWDEEIVPNESLDSYGYTRSNPGYYRSKNYIPVIGGMNYHFCMKPTPTVGQKKVAVQAYDSNKTLIHAYNGDTSTNKDILLDENAAYIRFYTNQGVDDPQYENNVTINLAWSGYRNGEYEPYWTETKALPTLTYFPDGMKSAGTVRDELTRDRAVKRCETRTYQTGDEDDASVVTDGTNTIYALEEPIETPIEPPLNFVYRVDDFGTEMLLPENDDEPTTTPMNASIYYGINYAREVINLGTRVDAIEEGGGSSSGGITGITAAGTPLTPVDGVVDIPKAQGYYNLGLVAVHGGYGIDIRSDGVLVISKATSTQINDRRTVTSAEYKTVTAANLDYAVKAAMTDGIGPAWTDAEKTGAWSRLNSIKTTMDSVAVAGARYYLGTQSAVTISMPTDALVGQEISCVFYSGATAATLSIIGDTIGDIFVPEANQRIEISMLWDGHYWAIVGNVMNVPQEVGGT